MFQYMSSADLAIAVYNEGDRGLFLGPISLYCSSDSMSEGESILDLDRAAKFPRGMSPDRTSHISVWYVYIRMRLWYVWFSIL